MEGDFNMEENKNNEPIETSNKAINLYIVIITFILLAILLFTFKSYIELQAIHELLQRNLLFK